MIPVKTRPPRQKSDSDAADAFLLVLELFRAEVLLCCGLGHEHLVDACAVHVHYFDIQAVVSECVACMRNFLELFEDKAGHR